MSSPQGVQPFNLATMSGVYPGTRTQLFHRLRVARVVTAPGKATSTWLQLLWYADPALCVLYQTAQGQATLPLAELSEPLQPDFLPRLATSVAATGGALQVCGNCRYWQTTGGTNVDGLPLGRCLWSASAVAEALPIELAQQAQLALACEQWSAGQQQAGSGHPAASTPAPLPKVAESAEIRLKWWQRIQRAWQRRMGQAVRPGADWAQTLLERSGVGAGTEPCFVCHGRLANLGALAVATPEGDKETFSLWRCRTCFTLYLQDWVDRWERLESLETEERYFRLAPAEAFRILSLINSVVGGEHPGRRSERTLQRNDFLAFLNERTPLSHQIRQGR
jgi:hypothetical protein